MFNVSDNNSSNTVATKDNMTDIVSDNPYSSGDNNTLTPQPQSDNSSNQPSSSNDNTTPVIQEPTPSYEVPGNDGKPIQLGADTTTTITK